MVKAKETNLVGVLEGTKQYQVPLYQRTYSWGRKQIDQLWDDIVEIAAVRRGNPEATHFIGSLVLAVSPDIGAVGLNKFLVVDGQQRLTTLTLLLAALRDHQAQGDARHRDRIDDQYLHNRYEEGQPLKLLPTQADREPYEAVIRSTALAGREDAVGSAYRFFRSKIEQVDDPDDAHDIADIENAVLRGLALVAVTAEQGDNAHRIFESLNNTGLRLTQADLLKNYLFMRLGPRADAVYQQVWRPLERLLDAESLELLFWLDLVQTDELAKQSDTYLGQQRRLEKLMEVTAIEADIRRIAAFGELLATVLDPKREPHHGVRRRLERLRAWGSTTAYPVIMQILARRSAGTASDEQVEQALLYLESYFVRRIVIGRATAGLNRSLLQAANAVASTDNVDRALRRFLSTGRKHFATDQQVREAVTTVPFYWQGRAAQKKLILQWLEESFGSKERVDPANLTIEHVLPQSMSAEVREEFSRGLAPMVDPVFEHERLVHTLGNLTLTGYNSELSNLPFSRKRVMLANTGIQLSREVSQACAWSAAEIEARGRALAERVIDEWPGPEDSAGGEGAGTSSPTDFATRVGAITAAIPAGRWTTYGEVAIVAGSHAVGVGSLFGTQTLPNAWRVLQAGGSINPAFRWPDPDRTDDPRELLRQEEVQFDGQGRAAPEQFLGAEELAGLTGLDANPLGLEQRLFWERVRAQGIMQAPDVSWGRTPRPQHWYSIAIGSAAASVELTVNTNTVPPRASVALYIDDDQDLFDGLLLRKDELEERLGEVLEPVANTGVKARSLMVRKDGDFRDPDESGELADWLIVTGAKFVSVFSEVLDLGSPYLPGA